jgi:hypothetical protein
MSVQAYLSIAIACALLYLSFSVIQLRKENEILKGDVSGLSVALNNAVTVARSESGKAMAMSKTIQLSQDAAKDYLSQDIKNFRDEFRVKIKDLKTYTKIGTSYSASVQAKGRDTLILQTIEKIYNLNGNVSGSVYTKGDSLFGKVVVDDTVRITVSKGKRKQWWKVWEKRPLVTNAFLSNKSGTVTDLKSVIVE